MNKAQLNKAVRDLASAVNDYESMPLAGRNPIQAAARNKKNREVRQEFVRLHDSDLSGGSLTARSLLTMLAINTRLSIVHRPFPRAWENVPELT